MFCFEAVKCVAYRIGTADLIVVDKGNGYALAAGGAPPLPSLTEVPPRPPPMPNAVVPMEIGGMDSLYAHLIGKIETLEASLTQLSGVVCWHDIQLQGLDGYEASRSGQIEQGG